MLLGGKGLGEGGHGGRGVGGGLGGKDVVLGYCADQRSCESACR